MRMSNWLLVVAALSGTLAGCAISREAQVKTALTNAGLPVAVAQCMAQPMARDLSTRQLRALADVSSRIAGRGNALSEGQILDLLRRDLDVDTVSVVARAGLGCLLRG